MTKRYIEIKSHEFAYLLKSGIEVFNENDGRYKEKNQYIEIRNKKYYILLNDKNKEPSLTKIKENKYKNIFDLFNDL